MLASFPITGLRSYKQSSVQKFPGGAIKFQEIFSISRRYFTFEYISSISLSCRHSVINTNRTQTTKTTCKKMCSARHSKHKKMCSARHSKHTYPPLVWHVLEVNLAETTLKDGQTHDRQTCRTQQQYPHRWLYRDVLPISHWWFLPF